MVSSLGVEMKPQPRQMPHDGGKPLIKHYNYTFRDPAERLVICTLHQIF
jgi:hypothetical protein